METKVFDELRVGPRSLLTVGTKFRVSGGPYYKCVQRDGSVREESLAERGVFVFKAYCERGRKRWIEAWSDHGHCVLSLSGSGAWPLLDSFVRRPYKVKSLIREKTPVRRRRQSLKRGA